MRSLATEAMWQKRIFFLVKEITTHMRVLLRNKKKLMVLARGGDPVDRRVNGWDPVYKWGAAGR